MPRHEPFLEMAETHQARRMAKISEWPSPKRTQGGSSDKWNKVDDVTRGEIKRKEVTVEDGLMPMCGVRMEVAVGGRTGLSQSLDCKDINFALLLS